MTVENSPSYYGTGWITTVKMFYETGSCCRWESSSLSLFPSSTIVRFYKTLFRRHWRIWNKLERLSPATFFGRCLQLGIKAGAYPRCSTLRLLKSHSYNICECGWSLPKWSTLNVGLLAVLTNIKKKIMLTGTNTLAYLSPRVSC